MKRKQANKKQCNRKHFESRCMQRLGIMIDPTDLANRIRKNKLKCIGKQTNSRTIFLYEYDGKRYHVIYSSSTKDVITIYPENDTTELNLKSDRKQKKWNAFLEEIKEQYGENSISEDKKDDLPKLS